MKAPSVSVILPLYNHEQYIDKTLTSIFEQTSPPDEIILIDDGSTDQGFEKATLILKNDPRAHLIQQENKGAHNTINRGIELARSEFIAILNTDDLFLPSKIERCRNIIENYPEIDFICGDINIIDENSNMVTSGETVKWLEHAHDFQMRCHSLDLGLLNDNYVTTTSNMFFSKNLWEKNKGFQNLRYCHDLDFILTALSSSKVVIDYNYKHINYRTHSHNTIKEKISKIRYEMAAVMANAMMCNNAIVSKSTLLDDIKSLGGIIDKKNNALLLSVLMTLRSRYTCKIPYYEQLQEDAIAAELYKLLN
uniref:Glycosyltransferases involved in cell wall biogenesis-like protein n=1 Tax=Chlorobium chlorochromatii (strain CaD3) TaxID=340177 RepID=Q3AQJ0_CHLCH